MRINKNIFDSNMNFSLSRLRTVQNKELHLKNEENDSDDDKNDDNVSVLFVLSQYVS